MAIKSEIVYVLAFILVDENSILTICRSSHPVTGTAYIVHANSAGCLGIHVKGMVVRIQLRQHF